MSRLSRLARIAAIVCRYRLDALIPHEWLPAGPRLLLAPLSALPAPSAPRGERLRQALESLGPVFIKFGQMLSTRRDLLPPDIADELARLQDDVPPFSGEEARQLIEQALSRPVTELFAHFDSVPLASASVAQVHPATLPDGRAVVVKVIRPGIGAVIRQDIALLYLLARLVRRCLPDGRRLRPLDVVRDYEHTILDELDLQREAANTTQLRRNFTQSPLLYVPDVHWDYVRENVMVCERIDGIPVTDVDALREQGTDMRRLAERGVEIFFTQVFRDNFFHADMHPGNIFVSRQSPHDPSYIAVDCAVIGQLTEFDQYYLARNLLAIFRGHYREVAALHVECGWVPPHTRVHELEATIRTVCEPLMEKPLSEISFAQVLLKLFDTARRFDMEVQPSLVLLQKTLFNIEGLGRQLYPALNLWETAKPFLEDWVRQRYAPRALWRRFRHHAPGVLEQLPALPERLLGALNRASQPPALPARDAEPRPPVHRRGLGVLMLVAAALLWRGSLPVEDAAWLVALAGVWLLW